MPVTQEAAGSSRVSPGSFLRAVTSAKFDAVAISLLVPGCELAYKIVEQKGTVLDQESAEHGLGYGTGRARVSTLAQKNERSVVTLESP